MQNMNLSSLSTKDLVRIATLIQRKERLQQQVAEIDHELDRFESGKPPIAAAAQVKPGTGKRSRRRIARDGKTTGRGALKQRIVIELKKAGKEGVAVKDLATTLGIKYGNVTSFFQSTGKRMKEIKKVGPARFAWVG
jgi:hypothetical protein